MIYTEHFITRSSEKGVVKKLEMKVNILNGGKENSIAFGLTVKPQVDYEKDERKNNFYNYKYHARNGYIYSQTETSKCFTEKIIKSQPFGTGDIVSLCVNLTSHSATFSKNNKKVGEVYISKRATEEQQLYPFVSLNTPDAVVRVQFYDKGKY